jgi:hypothetical protein
MRKAPEFYSGDISELKEQLTTKMQMSDPGEHEAVFYANLSIQVISISSFRQMEESSITTF